jgi:hypothetical protein
MVLDHGYEVSTARGRLEGALQVLIDRTESETSDESDVDVTDVLQEGRRYGKSLSLHHIVNSLVQKQTNISIETLGPQLEAAHQLLLGSLDLI